MAQKPVQNQEQDISEEALKERRYFWMARVFGIVCIISFITNILLLAGLFSLVPIVRIQPFYLNSQDRSEQVVAVTRSNNMNLNMAVLTESLIRQYLLARLTIGSDIAELETRWGLDGVVYWTSETSVFGPFAETAQAFISQARMEGLTRRVDILSVNQFRETGNANDVWQVELSLTDMKQGATQPAVTRWRVLMEVAYRPDRTLRDGMRWAQRLKNPMGFRVTKFGMQQI